MRRPARGYEGFGRYVYCRPNTRTGLKEDAEWMLREDQYCMTLYENCDRRPREVISDFDVIYAMNTSKSAFLCVVRLY